MKEKIQVFESVYKKNSNVFEKTNNGKEYTKTFGINLDIPYWALDYWKEKQNDNSWYADHFRVLTIINNRYVYRYFRISNTITKGFRYVEVARKIEGIKETLVNYCCDFKGAGGWWTDYKYQENKWWWADTFNAWCAEKEEHTLEVISKDKSLEWCSYEAQERLDAVEYISYYRKFPKLELLSKLGIPKAIRSYRSLKLNNKSFETIFGFGKEWLPYLEKGESVNQIKEWVKKGFKTEHVEMYSKIKNSFYVADFNKIRKPLNINNLERMNDYINDLTKTRNTYNSDFKTYTDYLKLAKSLGKDLSDNYWLFPKNVNQKHNELLIEEAEMKAIQDEEKRKKELKKLKQIDEKIKKVVEKQFNNLYLSSGQLEIKLASGCEEIMVNGDKLHNCVGRSSQNYMENMAKGNRLIMFAYYSGEVAECIEYDIENNKYIQVRGDKNQSSKYHESIIDLLNKLIKKQNESKNKQIKAKLCIA